MTNKILIVGKPFAHLENTLNEENIAFDIIETNRKITDLNPKSYKAILLIGINIALNSSSLDVYYNIISFFPEKTPIFFWNHEPFWDVTQPDKTTLFGRDVYFFNAHLRNVYLSPFSVYFGVGGYLWADQRIEKVSLPSKEELLKRFNSSEKKICAYASCFHDKRLDIASSIVPARNNLIKQAYDEDACDVYGRGWTKRWQLVVSDESRAGRMENGAQLSWGAIKVEQSRKKYSFSICLENCLIENYVTEKFAHAIESNLLPIYCKGNGLEKFMDITAAILVDPAEEQSKHIVKSVTDMKFAEYHERISQLTNSYNQLILQKNLINLERKKPAQVLTMKIAGSI